MTNELTCSHLTINNTMCKFCGRMQCDLCIKKHQAQHIANGDKEISIGGE